MTIEINVPIKCSTAKKITEIKYYLIYILDLLIYILACFVVLLLFPGTVLVFITSLILCILNIGGIISPIVSLISLFMIVPGYIIYGGGICAIPIKFTCIPDEVDKQ
jgi:hypothetical protein